VIARRLLEAAAEIERERGDAPVDHWAGAYAAGDRRIDAESVWLSLDRAFARARGTDRIVVAP